MADIKTKRGPDDDTDEKPSDSPNVGRMVIAGAKPATKTSVDEANQDNQPAKPSTPSTSQRSGQRGGGQSRNVNDALMRARADSEVDAANDSLSPTTLVLNYLRQQGLPRTSENVRRALEGNAQNPGMIPGMNYDFPANPTPVALVNDVAGRDPTGGAGRGAPRPPGAVEDGTFDTNQAQSPAAPPTNNMPNDYRPYIYDTLREVPPPGSPIDMRFPPPRDPALMPVRPPTPPGSAPASAAAQATPPPQTGGPVAPTGGSPPAIPGSEYVGRAPLQPSGRMIDQPGVALPPPNPTPALPSPLQSALDRALQGPQPQAQLPAPPPRPALPAPEGPPRIQATNPRMGVSGDAGLGIRDMMRSGARNFGPMGLAAMIAGGKSIWDEYMHPGSQPGYDVADRVAKKKQDQKK